MYIRKQGRVWSSQYIEIYFYLIRFILFQKVSGVLVRHARAKNIPVPIKVVGALVQRGIVEYLR